MAFSPVTTASIKVSDEPTWYKLREDLPHVMLSNMGPGVVYVALGEEDSWLGETAGMPIFPRTKEVLNKGIGGPGITVVCDSVPTVLVVTLGSGG